MKISILLFFAFLLCSDLFAQDYKIEGNELKFDKSLSFKKGSAELNDEDIKVLKSVKDFLNEKSYISLLRIAGNVNGTQNDQNLSEKRAMSAAQWLTNEGIDCTRLVAVGFGNTKPATQNTRITFELAALKGRLIGGMPADGGGKIAGDPCKVKQAGKN